MHFFYFFLGCVRIVVPSVSFQTGLATVLVILNASLSISSRSHGVSGLTEVTYMNVSVCRDVTSPECSVSVFQTVSRTSCTQHTLAIKCPFCL